MAVGSYAARPHALKRVSRYKRYGHLGTANSEEQPRRRGLEPGRTLPYLSTGHRIATSYATPSEPDIS
eukprot:2591995-Rhodomonas_salina.3